METRRCRFSHLFVCPLWSLSTWILNAQKVNGIFFFFLPLERGWSYKIYQKWLLMTPVFYSGGEKKIEYPKTHFWLWLLIMHFNEGWIIQRALVDVMAQCTDAVDIFTETWPSACVSESVFFWDGPCERGQRFQQCRHAGVCCCFHGQQLWFILHSHCWGPLYLTGKVKAYSLEAILQRSTRSLGMRNRMTGENRAEDMSSTILLRLCTDRTHEQQNTQQYLSFSSHYPFSPVFFLSSPPHDTSNITYHKNSWPWQRHLQRLYMNWGELYIKMAVGNKRKL